MVAEKHVKGPPIGGGDPVRVRAAVPYLPRDLRKITKDSGRLGNRGILGTREDAPNGLISIFVEAITIALL